MIDHSQCEHPRTARERSKCRRKHASGDEEARPARKVMGRAPKDEPDDDGRPKTPRDKFNECHVCGVERLQYQGTDAFTGMFVMVGEKCRWRVARSADFAATTS